MEPRNDSLLYEPNTNHTNLESARRWLRSLLSSSLTARQHIVMELLVQGLATKEIAARLGISNSAVKCTVQQLFAKAGVRSRSQLVLAGAGCLGKGWEDADSFLEACSVECAVLDASGTIIMVNRAWRAFAMANLIDHSQGWVGANYLEECRRAEARGIHGAIRIAEGVQDVLEGRAEIFTVVYVCGDRAEAKNFNLVAMPLSLGEQKGALLLHVDGARAPLSSAIHGACGPN